MPTYNETQLVHEARVKLSWKKVENDWLRVIGSKIQGVSYPESNTYF